MPAIAPDISGDSNCRLLKASEANGINDAWAKLAAQAIEPNVYYSPDYASALLTTVSAQDGVELLTVWRDGMLIGLLPIQRMKKPFGGWLASGRSWKTPYSLNGTPLIHRDHSDTAIAALVDGLAQLAGGIWVFNELDIDGPVFAALKTRFKATGVSWLTVRNFERASFRHGMSIETLLDSHLSAKRRKDLRRNLKRLEKLGRVSHESHADGSGLGVALDAFLELETSGWKGARGTALACRAETLEFAKRAFTGGTTSQTRIDLLLLDERPIAASVIVLSGGTGYALKSAYDERYRKCSAGLLLELEVVRSFLEGHWAERLDAATDGEHVIDFLWPHRQRIADIAISVSNKPGDGNLARFVAAQQALRSFKRTAKAVLRR